MEINLQNIEEQFFFNGEISKLLPEFRHLFDQWSMSKTYPGFGNLGKRSVIDLMNGLKDEHLKILEEYFGEPILLNKVDPHIIRNYSGPLEADTLCEFSSYREFAVCRDKDQMKITFWR